RRLPAHEPADPRPAHDRPADALAGGRPGRRGHIARVVPAEHRPLPQPGEGGDRVRGDRRRQPGRPGHRRRADPAPALPGQPGPPEADAATAEAARQRAEELAARAREPGADFAAIAREASDDLGSRETGGDLGVIEKGLFAPAFEEALFAMKEGQISEPVRTP